MYISTVCLLAFFLCIWQSGVSEYTNVHELELPSYFKWDKETSIKRDVSYTNYFGNFDITNKKNGSISNSQDIAEIDQILQNGITGQTLWLLFRSYTEILIEYIENKYPVGNIKSNIPLYNLLTEGGDLLSTVLRDVDADFQEYLSDSILGTSGIFNTFLSKSLLNSFNVFINYVTPLLFDEVVSFAKLKYSDNNFKDYLKNIAPKDSFFYQVMSETMSSGQHNKKNKFHEILQNTANTIRAKRSSTNQNNRNDLDSSSPRQGYGGYGYMSGYGGYGGNPVTSINYLLTAIALATVVGFVLFALVNASNLAGRTLPEDTLLLWLTDVTEAVTRGSSNFGLKSPVGRNGRRRKRSLKLPDNAQTTSISNKLNTIWKTYKNNYGNECIKEQLCDTVLQTDISNTLGVNSKDLLILTSASLLLNSTGTPQLADRITDDVLQGRNPQHCVTVKSCQ